MSDPLTEELTPPLISRAAAASWVSSQLVALIDYLNSAGITAEADILCMVRSYLQVEIDPGDDPEAEPAPAPTGPPWGEESPPRPEQLLDDVGAPDPNDPFDVLADLVDLPDRPA